MSGIGFISGAVGAFTENNKRSFYEPPHTSGERQVDCWRAWAASRYLEIRREWRLAKVWITSALEVLSSDDSQERLLRAEVLGLAGQLIFTEGDVGDALPTLVNSGRLWEDLAQSSRASRKTEADTVERLADEIRGMLAAFDPEKKIIPPNGLVQSSWLIQRWTDECLIESWSKVAATQARGLASSGRFSEALGGIGAIKDWMRGVFYLPPKPERRQNLLTLAEYQINHATQEQLDLLFEGEPQPATKAEMLARLREQIEEDTKDDHRLRVQLDAVVPMWRMFMAEGDVRVASGELTESVQAFEFAIRAWDDNVVNYEDVHMLNQAVFNQANSYLRLGRYEDARKNYAECIDWFDRYDPESASRARYADLFAQWKLNPAVEVTTQARQMLIEWESHLAGKTDRRYLHISKAPVLPLYQLLVSSLARQGKPESALDYFDVVYALREGEALTNWSEDSDSDVHLRTLNVVASNVAALPDTVLLLLQNAVDELTYLALNSSLLTRNPADGILNGVVPQELAAVFGELLERQQEELKAISTGRMSEKTSASPDFIDCCKRGWQSLPAELRGWLASAKTIIFLPDSSGNFDKVPLELFCNNGNWLGVDHAITRYLSITPLLEKLSLESVHKRNGEAVVIRAEDPGGFMQLNEADEEVAQVLRCLNLIGLKAKRATKVDVTNVLQLFDGSYEALHYCGHGLATTLSEGLPLARGETLQPDDLLSLSGHRTPFVYLSACEVGRTRNVLGGRQAGVAIGLLENGSPAVVGCLHALPDGLGRFMATAFYRAAKDAPVGTALSLSRRAADAQGFHPAAWGVYALYGNPWTSISSFMR